MRRGTTVYLWELAWILPSIAIPVGMLVALVVTAFGAGVHLPSDAGRIDSRRVSETFPPGVIELGPGQYEVRMPGEYPIICHEYCGIAHHVMAGKVVVE